MKKWIFTTLLLSFLALPVFGDEPYYIKALKDQASRIRGLKFSKDVPVGAKSRKELQKFVIKMFEEEMPEAKMLEVRRTLLAFGLIPQSSNLRGILTRFYTNNIGGFYDPGTKQLYIIGSQKLSQGAAQQQNAVIVHELIHALQDQNYDLFSLHKIAKNNDDQSAALSGLIEGDATLGMFAQQMAGTPSQQKFFVQFFQFTTDLSKEFMGTNKDVPGILQDTMFFNYTQGIEFNWKLKQAKGIEGINKAFRDIPASTEQILHPEKYISDQRDEPWEIELADLSSFYPKADGWEKVSENTMGELGTQILLREYLAYRNLHSKLGGLWRSASKNTFLRGLGRMAAKMWTAKSVNSAAAGWGGDRYVVYYNSKDDVTSLVWYTLWDTERDAREFAQAYRKLESVGVTRNNAVTRSYKNLYTSPVVVKGKKVIILKRVPKKASLLILQAVLKSKTTLYDRGAFKKNFPICQAIYALRFVDQKDIQKKKELIQKVLAFGKKAVPFLIDALDGESKKAFLTDVNALLKKLTNQDHGTDYKKWKDSWKKK